MNRESDLPNENAQVRDVLEAFELTQLIPSFIGEYIFHPYVGSKNIIMQKKPALKKIVFHTCGLNVPHLCSHFYYHLISISIEQNIDLECLQHMTENDIEQLVPQLNLRIKFRSKLLAWRRLKVLTLIYQAIFSISLLHFDRVIRLFLLNRMFKL